MQSQPSFSRGDSATPYYEEKKFASKSLDMNKLNKYKIIVAKFKKADQRIEKIYYFLWS